uniref:Plexin cytoplasmic RasGAP domain-containing protein n=1 Tax=Haplochromis burtoni TaxID=8153 RepID=A0A3Q2VB96_HAPBU
MKTLLNDLVEQYVAKNPKLMLRRTESVVEKLLTNWMSICLFTFLRESAGESFYMLFRAIKHQVDKGPVDAVTGKAKYTLNDNRLLREDVEYRTLTVPAKVLDCDTITQVKEKLLEQTWKGTSFSQRPHIDSLHLGESDSFHNSITLSCVSVFSYVRILIIEMQMCFFVRETVASGKSQRGCEREGWGASQSDPRDLPHTPFVDDLFTAILSTSRPVPLAVKYFFDLLDEQAQQHNIMDPETIHIWKTNSLPLRFWINILKNPQFIFDVRWWRGKNMAAGRPTDPRHKKHSGRRE